MSKTIQVPFFISIPHSGEELHPQATWLQGLDSFVLMRDVDRYVDKLYQPVLKKEALPHIIAKWHRYVVDLNRFPTDFDQEAVVGATSPIGSHSRGLHWVRTTRGEVLIPRPMAGEVHRSLVRECYEPFHTELRSLGSKFKVDGNVFHLDAHSMPSRGTALHSDPGKERADIVVSDYHGTTCDTGFKDIVVTAYEAQGFHVAYNDPYVGGGITRMYGRPQEGHHSIQVELNRSLYMDEETQAPIDSKFEKTQVQVCRSLKMIYTELKKRT